MHIDAAPADMDNAYVPAIEVTGSIEASIRALVPFLDPIAPGTFPTPPSLVAARAAPLARSMYLRPLQRLHAAYGRETVLVYQTAVLRSDPSSVMDDIFDKLSVYKPTLDPVEGRKACRSGMGLSAFDAELDCSVAVPPMDDKVKAAIEALLEPYTAALKAYIADDNSKATEMDDLPKSAVSKIKGEVDPNDPYKEQRV